MTVDAFLDLSWVDEGVPLIAPPPLSPLIADPSFLFPEETPDASWRLYAHSAWGIVEYRSQDGRAWSRLRYAVRNAMRAFVRPWQGGFVLLYEAYRPLALPLTILPWRRQWSSRIELRRSDDLVRWGAPRTLIEPCLPWMVDETYGSSVSNPCLLEGEGGPRLYFSASLVHVEDCGFEEPRYIGYARLAEGATMSGPWLPSEGPCIRPEDDQRPGVIGAGSMKVLRMEDGWIALQNKIYQDSSGLSRSALFVLRSEDGLGWREARAEPLLAPSSSWRSSHVYACDCRFRERDGRWYLYYNARDAWYKTAGTERIGRLVSA